jgi:hypothetical protein
MHVVYDVVSGDRGRRGVSGGNEVGLALADFDSAEADSSTCFRGHAVMPNPPFCI